MGDSDRLHVAVYLQKFGKYQAFVFALATLVSVYNAFPPFLHLFLSENYAYRCFIPGCDNESSHYEEPWLNETIPTYLGNGNVQAISSCQKFISNFSDNVCNKNAHLYKETESCSKFVFESSQETLARKWNLLCDRQWIWDTSESVFMVGVAFGTFITGLLSDRFGRKRVFIIVGAIFIISSTAKALAPNFIFYIFTQFVVGFATQFSTCIYSIFFECISSKARTNLGIFLGVTYAIGELLLALCVYYFKSWKILMYFVSFLSYIFIIYFFVLPESILWLSGQPDKDKLKKELLRLAKCNKLDIDFDIIGSYTESAESKTFNELPNSIQNTTEEVKTVNTERGWNVALLYKVPCLRKYTICQMIIWFCVSFVYFGTSLGSKSIGPNYLITFLCLSAVEIPGLVLAILIVNKYGRKPIQVVLLIIGCIVCYANILIKNSYPLAGTILAVIGKGCIAAQWSINVVYTIELFPTNVRNTGYSFASLFARIAVIISAYIPDLAEKYPPAPMIIFGTCGLIAAIAMLFLPETANRPLLDTVEQTEQFDRSSNAFGKPSYGRLENKNVDNDC